MTKTYQPSGRYRRTTSGIFFSRSSLMAIWRGSVSPSRSTRTGAFMLFGRNVSPKGVLRAARSEIGHLGGFCFLLSRFSKRTKGFCSWTWIPRSPFRRIQSPTTHLICNALVPSTRARSYFVMYGVVLLFSFGIFLSLNPCTAFFFPPPVAFWPPGSAPSPTGTIVWPFASPSPWPDSMCRVRLRLSVPSGFSTSSGSWGSKTGSSSSKVASAGS